MLYQQHCLPDHRLPITTSPQLDSLPNHQQDFEISVYGTGRLNISQSNLNQLKFSILLNQALQNIQTKTATTNSINSINSISSTNNSTSSTQNKSACSEITSPSSSSNSNLNTLNKINIFDPVYTNLEKQFLQNLFIPHPHDTACPSYSPFFNLLEDNDQCRLQLNPRKVHIVIGIHLYNKHYENILRSNLKLLNSKKLYLIGNSLETIYTSGQINSEDLPVINWGFSSEFYKKFSKFSKILPDILDFSHLSFSNIRILGFKSLKFSRKK